MLFTFDNAPPYTPLPVNVSVAGITASLSGTGLSYSIQNVGATPVHPLGFSGNFVYPSGVFAADLLVGYSKVMTSFSIGYALNELGCDDSATVRVTAYLGTTQVGTNTATIANPNGMSYPVGTLSGSFLQGFDNVVVHWDKKGPTCQDYGPNMFFDNMVVTPAWPNIGSALAGSNGTPLLVGAGPLTGNSSDQLSLSKAKASAPATLVFGAAQLNAPLKGGVLVPAPLLIVPMVTNAAGTATLPFTFPAGVPVGTPLYFQQWIQDPGAVKGFAASNAVMGVTG